MSRTASTGREPVEIGVLVVVFRGQPRVRADLVVALDPDHHVERAVMVGEPRLQHQRAFKARRLEPVEDGDHARFPVDGESH